tara:strand:+ start:854 stop:1429 length:576 start_codon:yes stop_codon:yes gene_type:complete
MGDYERYRLQKSVPGDRSGRSKWFHTYTNCKNLPQRVVSDNPKKVYIVKGNTRCKKGYYKVMMFVTGKKKPTLLNSGDFHFYKQHGLVEYKPKEGDTKTSIAKFFKVSPRKIPKVVVGKMMKIRVNVFSHKRGWATGPLLKDAKGKVIKDPRKASRNYGGLNYNTYCSSFCVKNRGINVGKVRSNLRKKSV